ncbi:MAG: hypothetical protein ABIH82_05290 [Candidatus Woesearchaeota archaeon]
MDYHAFNTLAELVNRKYFHQLFGVPLNPSSYGIDLIDHERRIAIELKGAVVSDGLNKHNFSFKVGAHQINEYPLSLPSYELFWAFMPFEVTTPIAEVTPDTIEKAIGKREIWIFDWDYIHTFTVFDDVFYETHGANGYNAAFRILDLPNPYFRKPRKKREHKIPSQLTLIELEPGKYDSKKHLSIARSQLHIREDRKTELVNGNTTIYLDLSRCKRFLDAFLNGPYQSAKEPTQLVLEL